MIRTLVFFATYNESGNVLPLLLAIRQYAPDADILVVDDNSSDGTAELLRQQSLPNLTVMERKGKLGLGTAHLLALLYARSQNYDVVVTMDGDLSHDPLHLPALLAKIAEGFDIVIGSRYIRGGSCDYSGYRLYVSKLGNIAARSLLRIKLHEFTTSYRAFRVAELSRIDFRHLLVGGYSFFLTMMVAATKQGLRISEVPIHFHERGYGVSKIPAFEVFRGMGNLIRLARQRLLHARVAGPTPLLSCGVCGTSYSFIATGTVSDGSTVHSTVTGRCMFCGHSQV